MLLGLDAQKAFDHLKWNFLYQTLKVFWVSFNVYKLGKNYL